MPPTRNAEQSPQPEESPQPEPSPQPEESPQPEPSPQPEESPQPERSPQREQSPPPEDSPQPQQSPRPESNRSLLSPFEKMQLGGLRAAMRGASWIAPMRARGQSLRIAPFRYGTHALEVGDVLESAVGPVDRRAVKTPVVYVHGGGWVAGHRVLYTGDLAFLAHDGRPVANLDYPLAPEAPHPEPLEALLRALAALRADDPRFERVHLVGDSAGGNLVVMLALLLQDRAGLGRWAPAATTATHPEIASVISLYGVLDRLSWLERRFPMAPLMLRSYAGHAAFATDVAPETAITPADRTITGGPPMWIAYGDRDALAESSRIGARHLEQGGIRVHLECHPGEGHGFFNFGSRPEAQRLRRDMLRFLDEVEAEPTPLDARPRAGGETT